MTTVEMLVHMDCPGCVSKIRKVLENLKGIDNVDIDVGMQKVTVTGSADPKKVLKTVRRTGKRAEIWQLPYDPVLRNHDVDAAPNFGGGGGLHAAAAPYAAVSQPVAASSYNYYKHGSDYGQDLHSSYKSQQYGQSRMFGNWSGDALSEDSANGCSIM